ncbi:MAG: fibronectin type III domain-containing protein [candidate division KSB1 bacterium]|nr:fibronectin type III domain-containing protein [candidate division KSB1 bacterium]
MRYLIPGVMLLAQLLSAQIIVDHHCTDITQIPQTAIESAKDSLHIVYGHTSHGSQITDGMQGLVEFANNGGKGLNLAKDIFAFNSGGALDLEQGDGYGDGWMDHDCGYYPDWVNETREYLEHESHADVNVVMWSWCGQASWYSEEQMNTQYLQPMTQLQQDYPQVTFVYMTGHADGSGESGNLHQRNQQIRQYCEQNGNVLYDFYDIECYDPDGVYYGDQNVDDGCNYDGGNWATEWQNAHTEGVDWYNCGAAHSQPLNANQKAYAAWWLWARLAGWHGSSDDSTPPSVPQSLSASAVNETRVDLFWDAAADAESGILHYRVYRQDSLIQTPTDTACSDTSCIPGMSYAYRVSAVNSAGLESTRSAPVPVTLPSDTQAPSVPANLMAVAVSSSQIDLTWSASSDNTSVTGYVVYRDGTGIGQTEATAFSDTGLSPATTYVYQLRAHDAADNTSALCGPVNATTLNTTQETHNLHLETTDEVDDSFIFADDPMDITAMNRM